MRKGDPVAYEPKIISFGPYCRDNPALKPMEQLKLRYVQRLLLRNPNNALDDYVNLIRRLEVRSRACYCEDIDMESHKFVEMMLLDGCFFVEFLLITHSSGDEDEEEEEDPVLTTSWVLPHIMYDVLMLENQIPFFIIEKVFKLATNNISSLSLTDLLLRHFRYLLPIVRMSSPPDTTFYHVLHFVHSCIMPFKSEQPVKPPARGYLHRIRLRAPNIFRHVISNESSGSSPAGTPESVPCATMLMDAGVKFREKKASSFLEVAFHNGTMEIPTLQVDDGTNYLFRNLIAFQQCFPKVGTHVVTYVALMDLLLDSGEDVALLRRHGCIESMLGSDEDVALLFNRLCKDVLIDTDSCYLASVFKDVKKHCDSRWHKYRAKLVRDYFSNPWAFLSLLGALTVILLTALQTSFAIVAYFKPPLAS